MVACLLGRESVCACDDGGTADTCSSFSFSTTVQVLRSILDFLMSQPLNVAIRESKTRQRNENIRRRIEVLKYSVT